MKARASTIAVYVPNDEHKKTHEQHEITVQETYWKRDDYIPVFTQDRGYLRSLIPRIEAQEVRVAGGVVA